MFVFVSCLCTFMLCFFIVVLLLFKFLCLFFSVYYFVFVLVFSFACFFALFLCVVYVEKKPIIKQGHKNTQNTRKQKQSKTNTFSTLGVCFSRSVFFSCCVCAVLCWFWFFVDPLFLGFFFFFALFFFRLYYFSVVFVVYLFHVSQFIFSY